MPKDKARPSRRTGIVTVTRMAARSVMLKRLYVSLQKQLERLEKHQRGPLQAERDAKLLLALATALDRLHALEQEMKKSKDKSHAVRRVDNAALVRALEDRFARLARSLKDPGGSGAAQGTRD